MGFVRPESVKWPQKAMKTAKKARSEPIFRNFLLGSADHARFLGFFQQLLKMQESELKIEKTLCMPNDCRISLLAYISRMHYQLMELFRVIDRTQSAPC